MLCDRCQELVSARLDGESTDLEDAAVERHLARCAPCAAEAARLGRLARSRPTGRKSATRPDRNLVARVMDQVAWSAGSEAPDWARYGLLVIALSEMVLALPQLFSAGRGVSVHDLHHLGAWQLAFGFGLAVVAWQPERARGLLPFAGALGLGMAVTAAVDVIDHTIPLSDEVHHLVDFAGVLLLWVVGRSFRLRPARHWIRRRGRAADGADSTSGVPAGNMGPVSTLRQPSADVASRAFGGTNQL